MNRHIFRDCLLGVFRLATIKMCVFSFCLSFIKSLKVDGILNNLSTNPLEALFAIIGFQSVGHIRKMVGPYWMSLLGNIAKQ